MQVVEGNISSKNEERINIVAEVIKQNPERKEEIEGYLLGAYGIKWHTIYRYSKRFQTMKPPVHLVKIMGKVIQELDLEYK